MEQLQIAVRKFVPQHRPGPTIWLVGTSHVGDPEYYRTLQAQLDAQTVVLYEGVNAGAHPRHAGDEGGLSSPTNTEAAVSNAARGSEADPGIQTTLAKSLGLVFQLDAIDYDRPSFLNSDLSIDEIQQLMQASAPRASAGEQGGGNNSFSFLLQIMDGRTFLGSLMKIGIQFIGSDPKLREVTRLMLVETLGQISGDLSELHGVSPDLQRLIKVLIQARNQKVIGDVKTEFKQVPPSGSIAIFYGSGHMPDMEKRVVEDLHYRPAEEIWLTAFSADTRKTGLSAAELQMLRNMFQWQMDQLQHP